MCGVVRTYKTRAVLIVVVLCMCACVHIMTNGGALAGSRTMQDKDYSG